MSQVETILEKRRRNRERLEKEAPDLYNGFNEMVKYYYKQGALSRKYKELMAITAAVATRCVSCLANHTASAIVAGAMRREIVKAAAIGIEFGGALFCNGPRQSVGFSG